MNNFISFGMRLQAPLMSGLVASLTGDMGRLRVCSQPTSQDAGCPGPERMLFNWLSLETQSWGSS